MGIEDSVDVADTFSESLLAEVRAGIDEDAVLVPSDGDRGAGASIARVRGDADAAIASEGGYAHRSATAEDCHDCVHLFVAVLYCERLLFAGGGSGGLSRDGIGQFQKHHAEIEEGVLQQAALAIVEIAFGFVGKNSEDVDVLACADDVHAGLLAWLGCSAHLDDG